MTHLHGFGVVDGAAEVAALASLLVPPCVALWGIRDAGAVAIENSHVDVKNL